MNLGLGTNHWRAYLHGGEPVLAAEPPHVLHREARQLSDMRGGEQVRIVGKQRLLSPVVHAALAALVASRR